MASGEKKKQGSFIGTGAAKEIALDFTPRYVKVFNTETFDCAEQFEEMDQAAAKAGGIYRGQAGAAGGLTAVQGITLGERKFTVGTADSVNKSGSHMVWLAIE